MATSNSRDVRYVGNTSNRKASTAVGTAETAGTSAAVRTSGTAGPTRAQETKKQLEHQGTPITAGIPESVKYK